MKKVGHPSEFLFGICWWTWKTNNYQKNCWDRPIKNKIILIFIMLHFSKKYKEKHLYISSKSQWYDLQFLIYRAKHTEIGTFRSILPFYNLKTPKIKILKCEKICWGYHHFTNVAKITVIWCMAPKIQGETDRIFCHFRPFFALLPPPRPLPLMIPKIKILK